jgi:hypothetical protein
MTPAPAIAHVPEWDYEFIEYTLETHPGRGDPRKEPTRKAHSKRLKAAKRIGTPAKKNERKRIN